MHALEDSQFTKTNDSKDEQPQIQGNSFSPNNQGIVHIEEDNISIV